MIGPQLSSAHPHDSPYWRSYDKRKLIMTFANSHVDIAKLLLTEKLEEKIMPKILKGHSFTWKP